MVEKNVRNRKQILALAAVVGVFAPAAMSSAAVIRHVVAAGNWSSTTVWSTTSGGTAGASYPNGIDDSALMSSGSSNRSVALDVDVVLGTLSVTDRKPL